MRDPEAAKRVYSDLGFSIMNDGRHPTGTENSIADFGDAGGYLEVITGGSRIAGLLNKGKAPQGRAYRSLRPSSQRTISPRLGF